MRNPVALGALALLLLGSWKINADTVALEDEAHYSIAAPTEFLREVMVVFPATTSEPGSVSASEFASFPTGAVVLEDCCEGPAEFSSDLPHSQLDPDVGALRRRKLEAAFKAGVEKLGVSKRDRRFVRVTAYAMEGSCADATALYLWGRIDCDQLVLINPVIEELPQIPENQKPRAIDVVLRYRTQAEAERDKDSVLAKLGPYGNTARVFSGNPKVLRVETARELLRAYSVRAVGGSSVTHKQTGWSEVRNACESADVIFVGELHGNPGAHTLQMDVLRTMGPKSKYPFALATEQFERDTQAALSAFVNRKDAASEETMAGIEEKFINESRAWPNYADYRPMIEFCRRGKYEVIAGNVPRRLAARINKEGPEAFEKFTTEEKAWCASKINAPEGAYKDKFFEVMGSSTSAKKDDKYAAMERMYTAQCLKDDTMAESIVAWLDKNKNGKVMHINGAFHSAGGLGVPEKLKALRPDLKIVVITCIEADNPCTAELDPEDAKGNDFVVFVPGSRPNRSNEGLAHPK